MDHESAIKYHYYCYLKKYIKSTPIKGVASKAKPKEMLRAEPANTRTAGIDTYHSTMFTLLLELNVACEQRWMQFGLQNSPSRVFAFGGKTYTSI